MEYGLSDHYTQERGGKYFSMQNAGADIAGALKARYFRAEINPDHSVLDFGCGGGWVLKNLDCARRVGVEPNLHAHRQCVENGVEVFADASQAPGSFDRIISNHCLEHVPHPIAALKILRGKLKEGGKLVLVLPLDDWRTQKEFRFDDKDNHLQTWTPLLLGNSLVEAGFRPQTICIITHAWPPYYKKFYKALPGWAFDMVCHTFSVAAKRRQIFAVAI